MTSLRKLALTLKASSTHVYLLMFVLLILVPAGAKPIRVPSGQSPTKQTSVSKPRFVNPCHVEGKLEIAIDCIYEQVPAAISNEQFQPPIILTRAKLWFKAKDDSRMRVDLTFSLASPQAFLGARAVYLAIDDESGQNHVRRQLPLVDFTKLVPGKPVTFSEVLRAPAFQPGNYSIYLWIPSSDPSLKFDATHNFLFSNAGVPDEKSGLNTIATFTVVR